MKPATIVVCLSLYVCSVLSAEGETSFCYRDEDGCGPSSSLWPALCKEGQRQSPVDLPLDLNPRGLIPLRLVGAYRNNFFRLQNSGHSVVVDFVGESGENEGPTSKVFTFPDPLNLNHKRQYKFASAHFHWGADDSVGSEHTLGTTSTAMEAHFVHYLASYPNMTAAVESKDESALTVLGLFIDVSTVKTLLSKIIRRGDPNLAPIVNNLDSVQHASHGSGFVRIDEPIDFTQLIITENPAKVYTYKGSLTTPGCDEQVNWFVIKKPATIPHSDVEAFRTKLIDGNGVVLDENHRPIQALNGRKISLTAAIPVAN